MWFQGGREFHLFEVVVGRRKAGLEVSESRLRPNCRFTCRAGLLPASSSPRRRGSWQESIFTCTRHPSRTSGFILALSFRQMHFMKSPVIAGHFERNL